MSPDREWWLRVPAVLIAPRPVFLALRDESREQIDARAEPILALVYLAGVAAALASSTARTLYDSPEYDALLVAVWVVIAGGFIAFVGYFVVGAALYLGALGMGSEGTFRRARHMLGFSLTPLALSLIVLWPIQLAAFGTDIFRRGGSDEGTASTVFGLLALGFALWSAALLLIGVRAVHGWSWWRSLGALGLVALFLAAYAYLPEVL
jgi:hypothetical protein